MKKWKLCAGIMVLGSIVLTANAWAGPEQAEAAQASKETMFSLIRKGVLVMIPLGICSILAAALAIERFLSLRREQILPPGFMEGLAENITEDPITAEDKCVKYCDHAGGPLGVIFKAGVQRLFKNKAATEKAIEDAASREVDKMKRSLKGLSTIAAISPLLGLLGTVYGMISAFQIATSAGMGKADVLAKGIYEALVTTAAGLTIAIPVLLIYQYLNNRVDALVDEMDEMGNDFLVAYASGKEDSQ
ncbi:MAG: MotA/TolQ/ExbB proton channel family protein [Verrucomicrobia bacterium]|nr:MAG: MotA/TolQ/ExbB proton channel family protein [Verrucomicrobiota bacterium]